MSDDDDITTTRHHHNDRNPIGTPPTMPRADHYAIIASADPAKLTNAQQAYRQQLLDYDAP